MNKKCAEKLKLVLELMIFLGFFFSCFYAISTVFHIFNSDSSQIHVSWTIFIRPSKTGHIMLSPVAGGQAASPILCPEHISKTMLATVMKLHGWIDLIKAECSAQEP